MAIALTTANKVIKEAQWSLYPLADPNPAFTNIGDTEDFNVSRLINTVKPGKLGIETKYKIMRVGNRYRLALKIYPVDTVFMAKCINLVADDASNNRDQPLVLFLSQLMDDGTGSLEERYVVANNAMCNSCKIDVSAESLLTMSTEHFARQILKPDPAHGFPDTPVFASPLSADPLTNLSPGLQPFTYNSVAAEYMSISATINHGTKEPQAGGDGNILGLVQMTKEVSLDVTVFPDGNITDTMLDDLDGGVKRNCELEISGTHKLVFETLQWESMEEQISQASGDVKMYTFKGSPINARVTTI